MPAFATPEPITTTLTTGGARVRIAASERSDTVVLVEPVNSANRSHVKVAENTKVEYAAGELSIETIKAGDKNGSVAITIELPVGSKLVLNTAWSDVYAEGLLGDCELNLASGKVQLDQIAALRGNLSTGDVAIDHIAGTVDLESSAAAMRFGEVEGLVNYKGANGKLWIGHALSDVDFSNAGGSFDIDRADANVTAKAAACPIRIGRLTSGEAHLTNASGGIEIGISDNTTAWVDADSTKGTVRNTLPTQNAPTNNDLKVYARTRRDNIVIHPVA